MEQAEWKPDICVHHFPCDDGFGSAWCVWKKWGNEVEYYGVNHGDTLPSLKGKNVLFVDFALSAEKMKELLPQVRSIVVLDHHKTVQADLEEFSARGEFDLTTVYKEALSKYDSYEDPFILSLFDMDKCGARLAWEFCFPGEQPPEFILYIEDQDLWNLKYEHVRRFSLAVRSYPYEFEQWNVLSVKVKQLIEEGKIIERFYEKKIADVCKNADRDTLAGHEILVANAPAFMASDVAHELLKRDPDIAFAAVWYEANGKRAYSLRSEDHRVDVSEIATQFGGGGHRNAAGFRVKTSDNPTR